MFLSLSKIFYIQPNNNSGNNVATMRATNPSMPAVDSNCKNPNISKELFLLIPGIHPILLLLNGLEILPKPSKLIHTLQSTFEFKEL